MSRYVLAGAFVAILAALAAGGAWAAIVMLAAGAVVFAAARLLTAPGERSFVVTVTLGGFALRAVFTAVLHLALVQTGSGGALFLDDAGYVAIGEALARAAQGENVSVPVDPSLVNAYLTLVGALFALVGPNVAALKLLNTGLATLAALFVSRTATLAGGPRAGRWALVLMLVFPSLVLWSSLTLKDSFALLCATGAVWCVSELVHRPRWAWFLGVVLFVLPLQSTRQYLSALLLAAWPPAVFLALRAQAPARALPMAAAALAVAAPLLVLTGSAKPLSPDAIASLEGVRRAMAIGRAPPSSSLPT